MKKTKISRKIGRRGKTVLAVLIAVMLIGVVSASVIPYFGIIKTTMTVDKQAVEISADNIEWHSYNEQITHSILDASPGGTSCFKQWIRSNAAIPVNVTFDRLDGYDEEVTTTYVVKTTDDNTIDNFGSRDNEVVAFPISSSLTLDELFAEDGLSYIYTILDGGTYDGATPVITVIDLEDGRHIALFPGWGERTDTYTLQFSDTIAYDSGGNNFVDFALYPSDFSVWLYGSVSCGYGNFADIKIDTTLIDGTEVVIRIAIQHQSANTDQTDELISLTFSGTTNDFTITEDEPFILQPGEILSFYICYVSDLHIGRGTYSLTTKIDATEL